MNRNEGNVPSVPDFPRFSSIFPDFPRFSANIFGFQVSGLLAWLVWLFIHLMYIVEFQSRVVVFVQWGFEYLTFSRGARLITGVDAEDAVLAKSVGPKADAGS